MQLPTSSHHFFFLLAYCASHSFVLSVSFFPLCTPRLYLRWTEGNQPVRHRAGIFLCPSSPTLCTDTLSLSGAGSVGCGNSSASRAATSPLLSSVRSDPTLLRKSVSFTEDLLLGASGTVGLYCASGVNRRTVDTQIDWSVFTRNYNQTCMLLMLNCTDSYFDLSMWCDVFGNNPQNFSLAGVFIFE